jgi:hypothetical protein
VKELLISVEIIYNSAGFLLKLHFTSTQMDLEKVSGALTKVWIREESLSIPQNWKT